MSWTSEVEGDLLSRMEVFAKEDVMCLLGAKEQRGAKKKR